MSAALCAIRYGLERPHVARSREVDQALVGLAAQE